jgi:probable rRNA maturation factor
VSVTIDITVAAAAWKKLADAESIVRRAIETALDDAGESEGEVGIVLCEDARMQELNRTWRGKDKPTNVLSFPASASGGGTSRHFGDIVLAYETLTREAKVEGKTPEAHLSHLAVHGMLHLLGFDHVNDGDADKMENRERKILARLGIPDPYSSGEHMEREHA